MNTPKSLLINAKVSVLEIAHQFEALPEHDQADDAQLDLLWAKLENIKQTLSRRVRLIEAQERGIFEVGNN